MGAEKKSEAAPAQQINVVFKTTTTVTQPQQTPAAAAPVPATASVHTSAPAANQSTATKKATKILLRVKKADNYPATAASGEQAGKNRPKIYRNPRNLPHGANGTHRPIGPRGSVVLVSDNPHLDRSKVITNNPEPKKLSIRFKDIKGNIHEHEFPNRHAKKWDDDEWVSALNKWRYQTFSRKFRNDPTQLRGRRGKWTMAERNFLKEQVIKKVEEHGDRLLGDDWKEIAKAHKERFANNLVKKGEQLLHGVAVKDYTITERSAIAIRATFDKDVELKQMLEDMVGEYTDAEDEEEDGEPMEDVIEEEHGGDLDHHLEDPSDDEDDGRRPASNQTGAILVEGAY